MTNLDCVRQRMRTLRVPVTPIDSRGEARRVQTYRQTVQLLPAEERLVWHLCGEGEPSCFPPSIMLLEVNTDTFSMLLKNFAEQRSPVALWPDIPPFHDSSIVPPDAQSLYDISSERRDDVLRLWRLAENQERITDRITHGVDSNLGEFLVDAMMPAGVLIERLPRSLWGERSEMLPDHAEWQVMSCLAKDGFWAGRFLGGELMWAVFGGTSLHRPLFEGVSEHLPPRQHLLVMGEGQRWKHLSGDATLALREAVQQPFRTQPPTDPALRGISGPEGGD